MYNIVNTCQELLNSYPGAIPTKEYISNRLKESSQTKFKFGYFPNSENLPALTDQINKDTLINLNLLKSNLIEDSSPRTVITNYFENHPLIMPFHDPYGNIVGLVGRSITDNKSIPKYKNTQFIKGNYLFGLFQNKEYILKKGHVFLVEGQLDVIKANEIGLNNIVALGTNSMTNYQFSVITRYCNNLILLLDNDQAGIEGRKRIVKKFSSLATIRNFYVPECYKDIDEYVSQANLKTCDQINFHVKE
jgi:DNA primase